MKKLFALLLAGLMILSLVACSNKNGGKSDDLEDYQKEEEKVVDHYTDEDGNTFHFDAIDSETVTITAFEGGYEPHPVVIPDTLDGKTVVKISENAFRTSSNISTLTLPATLTTIEAHAFESCVELTELTIPASVTTIGVGAFANCSALTKVTFAATSELKNIEQNTFYKCTSLASITIPAYIDTIGTAAFFGCEKLASITVEGNADGTEGTQIIGAQAFQNCKALATLKLPMSVASIGELAFAGSENLYMSGVECPKDSYAEGVIADMDLALTPPPATDDSATDAQ